MTFDSKSVRGLLRGLGSLAGPLPTFDPASAPADPDELFHAWLAAAVTAGVVEPHAATLSTVDVHGRPSARVLILKDLIEGRWAFASTSAGRKGKELATTPWAALTFYWPALGRQVRVRGAVSTADADTSARDFLARSPAARAVALTARQSEPLADRAELDRVLAETADRVDRDPTLVSPDWTVYEIAADEVEFWQGDTRRRHVRLVYTRLDGGWSSLLLWP